MHTVLKRRKEKSFSTYSFHIFFQNNFFDILIQLCEMAFAQVKKGFCQIYNFNIFKEISKLRKLIEIKL